MNDIKQLAKNLNTAGKKLSDAHKDVLARMDDLRKQLPENGILQDFSDYDLEKMKGVFDSEKELVNTLVAWCQYIEKNVENVSKCHYMLGALVARHEMFDMYMEKKRGKKRTKAEDTDLPSAS